MKRVVAVLVLSVLVLAIPTFDIAKYGIVVYRDAYGHIHGKLLPKSQIIRFVKIASSGGYTILKVDKFFRIQVLNPKLSVQDIQPYTPWYTEMNGNEGLAWQVDKYHINAGEALEILKSQGIVPKAEVAVLDTGVAPVQPLLGRVDYNKGYASTALVDMLAQFGLCNATGTVDLSGLKVVSDMGFNYTFPDGTYAKYCIFATPANVSGTNSTVVFIQFTNPSEDIAGHGTFVASQIVASTQLPTVDNAYGNTSYTNVLLGVNPNITIIPVKADYIAIAFINVTGCQNLSACIQNTTVNDRLMVEGVFDFESLYDAANYIAQLATTDPYLKVVNMSLGGYDDIYDLPSDCSSIIDPMRYAGLTVVVAAGNDGLNLDQLNNEYGLYEFPAQCPGVIAVSALDGRNMITSFSNYGSSITFGAPGNWNIGVYWSGSVLGKLMALINETYPIPLYNGTSYYVTEGSGTSYAAPLVSGAIALLSSVTDHPIKLLEKTAKKLYGSSPNIYVGYGEPDVGAALKALFSSTSTSVQEATEKTTTITVYQGTHIAGPFLLPFFLSAIKRRRKKK